MFEICQSHDEGPWRVEPVSPKRFTKLSDQQLSNCFWTQQEAEEWAGTRNRWMLINARTALQDLESEMGDAVRAAAERAVPEKA